MDTARRAPPPVAVAVEAPRLVALADNLQMEVSTLFSTLGSFEAAVSRLSGSVPSDSGGTKAEKGPDCIETRLESAISAFAVANQRLRAALQRLEGAV